jgi:hypothetical protein
VHPARKDHWPSEFPPVTGGAGFEPEPEPFPDAVVGLAAALEAAVREVVRSRIREMICWLVGFEFILREGLVRGGPGVADKLERPHDLQARDGHHHRNSPPALTVLHRCHLANAGFLQQYRQHLLTGDLAVGGRLRDVSQDGLLNHLF